MTYDIDRNYGKEARIRILNDYHLESVNREIGRAKEDLKTILDFLKEIEPHQVIVKNTPFIIRE